MSRTTSRRLRAPRALLCLSTALALLALGGCRQQKVEEEPGPDYARPLGPGESALRKLGPGDPLPDIGAAFSQRDVLLLDAVDQSLSWFEAPSSRQFYPFEDICTHEQSKASLLAFRELIVSSSDRASFEREFLRLFDIYQTVGYNRKGVVLFTGYYSPEFTASRHRAPGFDYPIYRRPADLVTHPVTGEPQGRRMPDGSLARYPSRAEIEDSRLLEGTELAWLPSYLDAYIIQVNGSAKLRLTDGSVIYVGYNGKTDRDYVGLGKLMVEAGLIEESKLSLPAIRAYAQKNPERVRELIRKNESFVFFAEYDGSNWPAGSLGRKVTEKSTLATDKKIYPRGNLVMVDTTIASFGDRRESFRRFMLDQDTGGAIKAPGRADIYMGIGPAAELLAGRQYNEGTLYYFFLKPEYIDQYLSGSRGGGAAPARFPASGGLRSTM
ncbi:MAG TPA: MltA domain-containing protein [Phycisphaerales bacterium]|nr:MltA domain-containing protein [Phycisphaerales bacterium]HMP37934.1 MltA domain-containing protein [Phycisphaerales bacterium]